MSRVLTSEDAPRGRSEVVNIRITRHADDRADAVADRSDVSKVLTGEEIRGERCSSLRTDMRGQAAHDRQGKGNDRRQSAGRGPGRAELARQRAHRVPESEERRHERSDET
jgi:hypothetical protein